MFQYKNHNYFVEYDFDPISHLYSVTIYKPREEGVSLTDRKLKEFCISQEELQDETILDFIEQLVRELYLRKKKERYTMRIASQLFDIPKNQITKEQLWVVKKLKISESDIKN